MQRRGLVPIEVAAVIAAAVAAPYFPVPVVLPLLVCASIARWACGHSFGEHVRGPALHVGVGAGAGLAALVLALAIGGPLAESLTNGAVLWSDYPIVRGNWNAFAMVVLIAGATALASELVLRGWLVERVLELGRNSDGRDSDGRDSYRDRHAIAFARALPAIFIGAFAEALLASGGIEARIGAFCFGAGLGWIYVASGRNLVAPIAARVVFQLGIVALEAARLVD